MLAEDLSFVSKVTFDQGGRERAPGVLEEVGDGRLETERKSREDGGKLSRQQGMQP